MDRYRLPQKYAQSLVPSISCRAALSLGIEHRIAVDPVPVSLRINGLRGCQVAEKDGRNRSLWASLWVRIFRPESSSTCLRCLRQVRASCVLNDLPTAISLFFPHREPLATVGHYFASLGVGHCVALGALRIAEITGLSHIHSRDLVLGGE